MSKKKKSMFGVNTYTHEKPRKRPGRHKKNRNKHEKRMGKYRGKGKKGRWQMSLEILYIGYERQKYKLKSKKYNSKTMV